MAYLPEAVHSPDTPMSTPLLRPLLLALAVALAACRSTSHPYHFEPSPAEVQVLAADDGPLVARVLVGVMGAEREGKASEGHPDLLLRVRLEAKGPGTLRFDPSSVTVLGPDLASFGPARVDGEDTPSGEIEVPRGEARDLTLRAAFPRDGDLRMPRLTGVNVTLQVTTAAGARELSIALTRQQPDDRFRGYYDPLLHPGGGGGGGGGGGWGGRWGYVYGC